MKRKLIGLFSTLLLIGGTITPSASAVTAIDDTQVPQEQTTSTQDVKTSHSTDGISSGDTMSEIPQTSTNEEEMVTQESSTTEENVEKIKIDDINFPDEHFRNLLLQIIDSDGDGYLGNELKQTTELDLKDAKIESLEGIQNFKNLKKLEVQDNELQEVDLQQLKELNYLDISNNQLSKIDLSKNEKLNYFKGSEQKIMAFAENADNDWQITNDKLQPESDKIVIDSSQWRYDGTTFSTSTQTPLNYTYQVEFSPQVILNQNSESVLSVNVAVEFVQPENNVADYVKPKDETIHLAVGESKLLEYSVVPEKSVLSTPVWNSEDETIVQVDTDGKVTAKKPGTTEVMLSNGEKKFGKFEIIVSKEISSEKTNTESQTNKIETNKNTVRATTSPTISYQTHVKNIGWQMDQVNGATAGTTGKNLWIEAIKMTTSGTGISGDIEYSSHVKNIGWQDYVKNGSVSGTTGRVLQMEAIKIRLTGQLSQNYDVYYRVHSANFGWLGWAKNDEAAGTAGYVYQMEAIQVQLVAKNQSGPSTGNAFMEKNKNNPTISYQTFVKDQSWQNNQADGATSGTTGQNRWIEAMRVQVSNTSLSGDIEYSSHIKNIGWQNYVKNNAVSGTTDRYAQIEAIRIRLTGQLNQYYNVYYRVHSANFGWLGWTKNGESAGSTGFVYQVEALEIQLLPKGQSALGSGIAFYDKNKLNDPKVNYQAHLRNIGWQSITSNGETAGLTGKSARIEALKINVSDTPVPGSVEYTTHVQNIGWQGYMRNNELSGTTGKALHTEALRIRLTGQLNHFYDIYYRVHTSNIGWLDWAKNDQFAGTTGLSYPMEAIQVVLVKKGAAAPGKTDTPYQTSINHLFVMGHGVNDPGASYAGVNERDFTRKELMPYLQKWASRLSKNKITFYNTNADMYQDSQKLQGAYTVSDSFSSVSEFHLDAGAINLSTGGHVIAHRNGNSLTSQNYAIANVIRNYVGLWGSVQNTGGINLRADLLNMNVLQSRGIPYRLAELGFITNSRDVANIRNNIDSMTKGIVESVTGEKL